ncbi:hypothetical protein [Sphingomonas kyungheensis]|uniref:Ribbon-helix-helix protein CopG domain-containing protein n=1 Tax=Sphingomonas kyungheensis TaxID=1069987 RepID=A0ABU8H2L0_9SPHN
MDTKLAIRIPPELKAALAEAAAADFSSPASFARAAIVAELRRRGQLPEQARG